MLTDNGTHFTDPKGAAWTPDEIKALRAENAFFRAHAFEYACADLDIEHRLTKPRHPWTNGQVERMNRTIKDATVKRFHYDSHDQLRQHLVDFVAAYNFAQRLKTLKGITPYEHIFKCLTSEPERFSLDPIHQMPGLNIGQCSQFRGENECRAVAAEVSLAYISQGPIHRLASVVSLILRKTLDQWQLSEKGRVRLGLAMDRRAPDHGEGRAADELAIIGGKVEDERVQARFHEQISSDIDDLAGFEVVGPSARFVRRKLAWVGGVDRQDTHVSYRRSPKLERATVVTTDLPGYSLEDWVGEPEGPVYLDADRPHAGKRFFGPHAFEMGNDVGN